VISKPGEPLDCLGSRSRSEQIEAMLVLHFGEDMACCSGSHMDLYIRYCTLTSSAIGELVLELYHTTFAGRLVSCCHHRGPALGACRLLCRLQTVVDVENGYVILITGILWELPNCGCFVSVRMELEGGKLLVMCMF
jgi:hypothetical protein